MEYSRVILSLCIWPFHQDEVSPENRNPKGQKLYGDSVRW